MIIDSKEKLVSLLKNCSSILYDLDGTLFDLHVAWGNIQQFIYNHYKSEYGEEIPSLTRFYAMFEFIEKEKGKEVKQFYLNYLKKQEYNAVLEKKFSPTWLTNEGLDKIGEMIRFDTYYGIVSSNFHETILEVLTQYEMVDKFKIIIGRDDVEFAKPNPEGLNRIINAYDIKNNGVLFIGDSYVDEDAAQNAQVNFIYVENLQKFLT